MPVVVVLLNLKDLVKMNFQFKPCQRPAGMCKDLPVVRWGLIFFFFLKNSIFDFFLQRAASAWSAEEFQVTLFDPLFPVDGWCITTEVLNTLSHSS